MDIVEHKRPLIAQLNPLRPIRHLSFGVSRFASDFSWAYRTAFPTRSVSYDKRGRFVLRTLMNLQPSAHWFRYLKNSYLNDIATKEPSLVEAVHRPFFDRNITATKRASLMKGHFELFQDLFGARQASEAMAGGRITLCRIAGKTDENIEISMCRSETFKREGGATLELSVNNVALLWLTFSLVKPDHEVMIKVGGIQCKVGDCRDVVRDATHALHGIQPRLLLIEALRAVAGLVNCSKIECISKENHIYRSWRYRSKKTIHAEYDQLWTLAGGVENGNGNFDIPCHIEETPIEERPSKKRAEYRRRASLLETMRQQIHGGVSHTGQIRGQYEVM
ncbi:VirK/YbjX family protein [Undibacterium sp.]|uniref:VirK/YbjX family protein n=1 Tax=Undibacterium sp. TaxID=1914977 RepID=UPI00374C96A2